MTAQLAGVSTLVTTLHAAAADLDALTDAGNNTARLVGAAAAAAAPRRTGRLAGTVRAAVVAGRVEITFGGSRAVYAPVIHWGWPKRRIRANPFASRAAQRTETQWVEFYATDVQNIVDTVKGT